MVRSMIQAQKRPDIYSKVHSSARIHDYLAAQTDASFVSLCKPKFIKAHKLNPDSKIAGDFSLFATYVKEKSEYTIGVYNRSIQSEVISPTQRKGVIKPLNRQPTPACHAKHIPL